MTQSDCIVFGIDYNRTSRFDLAKHYYFQMFPRAGRFDNAVGLWKETAAKGFHPVNKVYCALAVGLCDGGKADSARIGKAQAIKLFMMKNEHEPDLVTYNVLLNYFCNELMLQEAEKLLKNMKRSGIGPDVYSYNQMIKGLRRVAPDVVTFTTLIKAFLNKGCSDIAKTSLDRMSGMSLLP
ncbi:hypothetical protein V6N13_108073 [Hibiscus sabdariffa]